LYAIIAFFLSIPSLFVSIFLSGLFSQFIDIAIGIVVIFMSLIYRLIPEGKRPYKNVRFMGGSIGYWMSMAGLFMIMGYLLGTAKGFNIHISPDHKHIILMSFAFLISVALAVIIAIITTKSQIY
jgi:hypothetical protein